MFRQEGTEGAKALSWRERITVAREGDVARGAGRGWLSRILLRMHVRQGEET